MVILQRDEKQPYFYIFNFNFPCFYFPFSFPLTELWRVYSSILRQSEITNETTFFKIQKMIVHPRYEFSESGYDIALLKLDRPLNFSGMYTFIYKTFNTILVFHTLQCHSLFNNGQLNMPSLESLY